ncbi:MAG: IclR family transcriptional regulator, partial [Planctomycetes bacterium]|nr:IclR family transcriptional regulator [Planctomycetota bacterium]
YLRTTNLHSAARPIMLDLAARVHQTVHLAVQSGDHAIYLDKIDSPGGLGMISKVGSQIQLHCTGVGKVILAYQPLEQRDRLLNSLELTKYTENTVTDAQSLNARLQEILELGYAFDRVEHEEDVACIAAPIFGYNGEFLAAISISGSSHRILDPKSQSELIEEALKASRSISEKMGYITTK